jgi:hypothetical protein
MLTPFVGASAPKPQNMEKWKMRTLTLDELVTEHALRLVSQSGNADFTDAILDGRIP